MKLEDLNPFIPLKSPIKTTKSLKFISLPSGQDVLSSPNELDVALN